jgi:hypothetical protein
MKRITYIVFFLLIAVNFKLLAQNNTAKITFEKTLFSFDDTEEGTQLKYSFKYTNTGKSPLLISDIRTTCGCTVSAWNKKPLAAGKSEQIEVTFDTSNKVGRQHKVLVLLTNATQALVYLEMQGNVLPKKE